MGQPVKQHIKEAHPVTSAEPIYTLLIDGNSLLRLAFADTRVNTNGIHYGGVFQFLLQLRMMMQKKDFDYVYCVFDAHDSGILRYEIYPDYKANRDKDYAKNSGELSDYMKQLNATISRMQDYCYRKKEKPVKKKTPAEKLVDENFDRERDILCRYFNELYIRWMIDEKTEGDDIIAYYVQNKRPEEKVVIMSGDEDLTQLISDTVCVYNTRLKKFLSKDNFKSIKGFPYQNVVLRKVFCGDKSDNIGNISGLSDKRLLELMPEISTRPVAINEVIERAKEKIDQRVAEKKKPLKWHENIVNGVSNNKYPGDFYEINEKIISLEHPLLTDGAETEIKDMMYNVQDPEGRSFENLYSSIVEDGIDELSDPDRFSFFFEPFKQLTDKEIKRYKKEMSK